MDALSAMIYRLEQALIEVNEIEANRIIDEAVKTMTPMECADMLIMPVLRRMGEGWVKGDVSLSQIYMGSRTCEKALDRLLPAAKQIHRKQPKVAIAVLEDYHNLGAKILWSVLRASGIDVINYDHQSISPLVTKVEEDKVEVLLVSTLMYRSALRVRDLREMLDADSCKVYLMVGGAPFLFDDELWKAVGADAMGKDASSAVNTVNGMSEVVD